ncbi:alpha/beta fold hydrolase [Curtobacterium sp. MCLR17_044]|uniref:alpha/beta fold hydrolase n=1 Tax=Curtobacterium sp. MCLR17_044 TaxID=2175628 RepID=UPI000DA71A37|nr:hypothetical protein DEJ04_14555 [Curtobacterium sp. MCLR17_044]
MTAPEVILVHGLYHQPQHMQPLQAALEERGAIVHVPRLHRGSLAADTGAVQQVVDARRSKPVLVAHSYGGAVAAGVRELPRSSSWQPSHPTSGRAVRSLVVPTHR